MEANKTRGRRMRNQEKSQEVKVHCYTSEPLKVMISSAPASGTREPNVQCVTNFQGRE
ncbi:adenylate kinase 5, chloroplastic [Sesbania bispinosa]|nr:adenylate kinase 5, chloroplastic [Sesbania bispinosa]